MGRRLIKSIMILTKYFSSENIKTNEIMNKNIPIMKFVNRIL